MPTFGNGRRVAIVAGVRTPFAKAGTVLKSLSAIELGKRCVAELIQRTNLDGAEVDAIVFGTVVPSVLAPNIAREVALLPMLPKGVQAFTVSRACASANQAITDAADQIVLGHADVVIAGGAESLSNVPILHSRGMAEALVAASRAKTLGAKRERVRRIRPRDLVPITPAIAEPSTGETMGQSAEKMAKINHISARGAGPVRAALAPAGGGRHGRMAGSPRRSCRSTCRRRTTRSSRATTAFGRADELEQLAALKPVFDRTYGTVTAGNSSPLTDGAAAVLLMSEERARALGYAPLAYIRSYAYAALDPGEQLLQGPVLAAPVALQRAGLTLRDIDLVEMHEAFAAQVLCNLRGFESPEWAERAGFDDTGRRGGSREAQRDGRLDLDRPSRSARPAARILTTLCNELARRGGAVRPDDRLRGRRHGARDGGRARR